MVLLLEELHSKRLVSPASSDRMVDILRQQFYDDMIPRFLPAADCDSFAVAHKTGGIAETKVDVGLVISDRAEYAVAIFVDKHLGYSRCFPSRNRYAPARHLSIQIRP